MDGEFAGINLREQLLANARKTPDREGHGDADQPQYRKAALEADAQGSFVGAGEALKNSMKERADPRQASQDQHSRPRDTAPTTKRRSVSGKIR